VRSDVGGRELYRITLAEKPGSHENPNAISLCSKKQYVPIAGSRGRAKKLGIKTHRRTEKSPKILQVPAHSIPVRLRLSLPSSS
jgi:hypothetical protein